MAQDPLIAALEEDARGQAARIIEEAEEARERLGKTRAAAVNGARTRAAGLKLAVRQELIQRAIDEAAKRFFSLNGEERSRLVARLYAELEREWARARSYEPPVVRVNPADLKLIEAGGAVVLPDESVAAGVVFTSADGRVRFENTVSSRMERAKKKMIPAINEMLFDEALS